MIKILTQDDCAPDSLEYFERDFEEITGNSIVDFIKTSDKDVGEDYFEYSLGGFTLSYAADYPFWELYRDE